MVNLDRSAVERRVGVLALQGASAPHLAMLRSLGIEAIPVRRREELDSLTHLVLPGGESTTLRHLLDLFDLAGTIIARAASGELSIFGTCAGAILLGQDDGERPPRLGLLEAQLERNAYGTQVDSFSRSIELRLAPDAAPISFPAVFIRAPRFVEASFGREVEVLARDQGIPVLVRQGNLLAATFHPELSGDPRIHAWFLEMWLARRDRPAPAAI